MILLMGRLFNEKNLGRLVIFYSKVNAVGMGYDSSAWMGEIALLPAKYDEFLIKDYMLSHKIE